jgi:hypothetical protein
VLLVARREPALQTAASRPTHWRRTCRTVLRCPVRTATPAARPHSPPSNAPGPAASRHAADQRSRRGLRPRRWLSGGRRRVPNPGQARATDDTARTHPPTQARKHVCARGLCQCMGRCRYRWQRKVTSHAGADRCFADIMILRRVPRPAAAARSVPSCGAAPIIAAMNDRNDVPDLLHAAVRADVDAEVHVGARAPAQAVVRAPRSRTPR